MLDKNTYEFLKKYTSRHKLILIYALLLAVSNSLLLVPFLYFIKQIFDINLPQKDMSGLLFNSSMILFITLIQTTIGYFQRNIFLGVVKKTISLLQKDVLTSLIWANNEFYDRTEEAKIVNSVVTDIDKVDRMADGLLSIVIPQLTLLILGLGIMLVYNPFIGFSTLIIGLLGILIQRGFKRKIRPFIVSYRLAMDRFASYAAFLPKKQVLTKLRNFHDQEVETATHLGHEVILNGTQAAKQGVKKQTADELMINASAVILIILGSFQILSDTASYGSIFGLYFLIVFIRRTAHTIQSQWTVNQEGKVSIGRIFEILENVQAEPYKHQKLKEIDFNGSIRGDHLAFSYQKRQVLTDVNFEIHPGEIVTISGRNGSGKSTLVKLLLGFYTPESGQLYAHHVDYCDLNINSFRAQIGYIPQNQVLINGTIDENLRYGLQEDTPDAITRIQKQSIYHQLMAGFEEGLETQVSPNGKNLSNGQIQRISILRTLCTDPKLLILDEPTNHLDADSIIALMKTIQRDLEISVLVISHHQLFHEISDRVYYMDAGKLNLLSSK